MRSFRRRLLVFEWLTGGGCWLDCVDPNECSSLLRQGRQMLQSVASDFDRAGFEVVALVDSRIEIEFPTQQIQVCRHDHLQPCLKQECQSSDLMLIIAPESGNRLMACLKWLQPWRDRLLNPSIEFTSLAANKNRLQEFLRRSQVPVPKGVSAELWTREFGDADPGKSWIVKPFDGCGGEGNFLVTTKQFLKREFREYRNSLFRVEEFVDGVSTSVAVASGHQGEMKIFEPVRQYFDDFPIGLFSHCEKEISDELANRALELVGKTLTKLPPCHGFFGLDLILGDEDFVLEINPRITCSYDLLGGVADWFDENFEPTDVASKLRRP